MRALEKIALTLIAVSALAFTATAGTLEDVKARGELRCVVSTGIAGFAYPDSDGTWKGFDVDFCRATAAAVLGDSNAITQRKRAAKASASCRSSRAFVRAESIIVNPL